VVCFCDRRRCPDRAQRLCDGDPADPGAGSQPEGEVGRPGSEDGQFPDDPGHLGVHGRALPVEALRVHLSDEDDGSGVRTAPGAALQRHDPEPEAHGGAEGFRGQALAVPALRHEALVRDGPVLEGGTGQGDLRGEHGGRREPLGPGPRCGHAGPEAAGRQVGRDHLQRRPRNAEGAGLGAGHEGGDEGQHLHLRRPDRHRPGRHGPPEPGGQGRRVRGAGEREGRGDGGGDGRIR